MTQQQKNQLQLNQPATEQLVQRQNRYQLLSLKTIPSAAMLVQKAAL